MSGCGTRWGRTAVLMLAALLVAATLGLGMTRGLLAAHLVVQDRPMKIATAGLYGVDFGLTVADGLRRCGPGCTAQRRIGRAGFADGQLNELCLAIWQQFPAPIGWQTLFVRAGDSNLGTWEIAARNVELDFASMRGELNLDGRVFIGVGGEDVTTVRGPGGGYLDNPLDAAPGRWRFGIDATYAKFAAVTGEVYTMELPDVLTLRNLEVSVRSGQQTCSPPGSATGWPRP